MQLKHYMNTIIKIIQQPSLYCAMHDVAMPPLTSNHSIVIIGASHSGVACAEKLRQLGFVGAIKLIDGMAGLPVERPPLSKQFLSAETAPSRVLRDADWFADKNIALITGQEVVAASSDDTGETGGTITLADGSQHIWQRLVLAVGAGARRLPETIGDAGNMLVLRDLHDARALRGALAKSQRVAIIGGGYIGLEVAASARRLGKQVVVLEAQPRLLSRVASQPAAEFFAGLHASQGVAIHTGVNLVACDKTDGGMVLAYENTRETALPRQQLKTDMVVVGIGVLPNTRLADMLGRATGEGIITDADYRTSQPSIFAIGDVALPTEGYTGGTARLESIHHAQMSGEIAAQALLADSPTPQAVTHEVSHEVPWFWSNQYDVRLQSAGVLPPHSKLHTVTRIGKRHQGDGKSDHKQLSFWSFADGRLHAVEAINDGQAYMVGRAILTNAPNSISADKVADPNGDLKSLAQL